jgi:hypothetical protein
LVYQQKFDRSINGWPKPGDFALYPDSSHIGVVVGWNEAGKLLICRCASGQNNTVITEFSASGFTAVGKLSFMG